MMKSLLLVLFLFLAGLAFLGGGVYSIVRVWFGDWRDFINTPSYDLWMGHITYLQNHWLMLSTIASSILAVTGVALLILIFSKEREQKDKDMY